MAAELTLTVTPVSGSGDAVANTSRVRIDLAITTTLGTWSHDYTTHGYIKLDGTQIVDLNGKWVDINTTTQLYSGEHTVSHNMDGTKTVTVEAGFDMNTTYTGWSYATRELALPTIPRASGLGVGGITLGADNTLTIQTAASVFTHTLTYTLGSASGTVCSGVAGGTVYWKPDISLCAQLPDSTSGSGTLTLVTYSGGSEIGRSSATFAAYVPSSAVPSVERIEASPVNDNAALRSWGVYVKGYSKVGFSVTAQGAYGSSVVGGSFSCAGKSVDALSGTTGVLASAGTYTPVATVKDSRNRISAAGQGTAITVYDYAVPTISASAAYRSDSDGTANESGTCIAVKCTAAYASVGGRNSVSLFVRTRATGGSWGNYVPMSNGSQTVLSGFSAQRSYDVEILAQDALGEKKTVVYTVPTEAITFMLTDGGEGAAFGKHHEHSGLDMGWDIHMNGNRVTGLPEPANDTDAVPLGFANESFAPNGYGLGDGSAFVSDCNGVSMNGWYYGSPDTANSPCNYFVMLQFYRTTSGKAQLAFDLGSSGSMFYRAMVSGTWDEWGWVNPPMEFNTPYRTTERFLGKPVYTMLLDFGESANQKAIGINLRKDSYMIIRSAATFDGEPLPYHYIDNSTDSWVRIYSGSTSYNAMLHTPYTGLGNAHLQIWYCEK